MRTCKIVGRISAALTQGHDVVDDWLQGMKPRRTALSLASAEVAHPVNALEYVDASVAHAICPALARPAPRAVLGAMARLGTESLRATGASVRHEHCAVVCAGSLIPSVSGPLTARGVGKLASSTFPARAWPRSHHRGVRSQRRFVGVEDALLCAQLRWSAVPHSCSMAHTSLSTCPAVAVPILSRCAAYLAPLAVPLRQFLLRPMSAPALWRAVGGRRTEPLALNRSATLATGQCAHIEHGSASGSGNSSHSAFFA